MVSTGANDTDASFLVNPIYNKNVKSYFVRGTQRFIQRVKIGYKVTIGQLQEDRELASSVNCCELNGMKLPRKLISKRKTRSADASLGVKVPSRGSNALNQFVISYRQINSFLRFILNMVGTIESTAVTAHEALMSVADDANKRQELKEAWKKRGSPLEELKKHRQFLLEIILVRHVENYLNFLSSLLKEIFEAKPESLRSAEKIDLETVLRHANIDDLVRTVAERKVESLSYASFGDLSTYFAEKFHLSLVPPDEVKKVVNAIETRNISVHNRCEMNRRFIMRTGSDEIKMGHLRVLALDNVEDVARCFARSAISVDLAARKRLEVRGHYRKNP